MCECPYDYKKTKYKEKAKLCYMVTDSFIAFMKTGDIYKDITKDVNKRFYTSNCKLDGPLPRGKIKK